MLTQSQINWASQHDWFVGRIAGTNQIRVSEIWTTRDGRYHEQIIDWTGTFAELRRWAGY